MKIELVRKGSIHSVEVKMKLEVERADNGYVIRYVDQDGEGESFTRIIVFEETVKAGHPKCERGHAVEMLYEILDIFGNVGSKHDEHRVEITCKCQKENQENSEASGTATEPSPAEPKT